MSDNERVERLARVLSEHECWEHPGWVEYRKVYHEHPLSKWTGVIEDALAGDGAGLPKWDGIRAAIAEVESPFAVFGSPLWCAVCDATVATLDEWPQDGTWLCGKDSADWVACCSAARCARRDVKRADGEPLRDWTIRILLRARRLYRESQKAKQPNEVRISAADLRRTDKRCPVCGMEYMEWAVDSYKLICPHCSLEMSPDGDDVRRREQKAKQGPPTREGCGNCAHRHGCDHVPYVGGPSWCAKWHEDDRRFKCMLCGSRAEPEPVTSPLVPDLACKTTCTSCGATATYAWTTDYGWSCRKSWTRSLLLWGSTCPSGPTVEQDSAWRRWTGKVVETEGTCWVCGHDTCDDAGTARTPSRGSNCYRPKPARGKAVICKTCAFRRLVPCGATLPMPQCWKSDGRSAAQAVADWAKRVPFKPHPAQARAVWRDTCARTGCAWRHGNGMACACCTSWRQANTWTTEPTPAPDWMYASTPYSPREHVLRTMGRWADRTVAEAFKDAAQRGTRMPASEAVPIGRNVYGSPPTSGNPRGDEWLREVWRAEERRTEGRRREAHSSFHVRHDDHGPLVTDECATGLALRKDVDVLRNSAVQQAKEIIALAELGKVMRSEVDSIRAGQAAELERIRKAEGLIDTLDKGLHALEQRVDSNVVIVREWMNAIGRENAEIDKRPTKVLEKQRPKRARKAKGGKGR